MIYEYSTFVQFKLKTVLKLQICCPTVFAFFSYIYKIWNMKLVVNLSSCNCHRQFPLILYVYRVNLMRVTLDKFCMKVMRVINWSQFCHYL
jgi:hypothetical protein